MSVNQYGNHDRSSILPCLGELRRWAYAAAAPATRPPRDVTAQIWAVTSQARLALARRRQRACLRANPPLAYLGAFSPPNG